jgi:hypothetical protein
VASGSPGRPYPERALEPSSGNADAISH